MTDPVRVAEQTREDACHCQTDENGARYTCITCRAFDELEQRLQELERALEGFLAWFNKRYPEGQSEHLPGFQLYGAVEEARRALSTPEDEALESETTVPLKDRERRSTEPRQTASDSAGELANAGCADVPAPIFERKSVPSEAEEK